MTLTLLNHDPWHDTCSGLLQNNALLEQAKAEKKKVNGNVTTNDGTTSELLMQAAAGLNNGVPLQSTTFTLGKDDNCGTLY